MSSGAAGAPDFLVWPCRPKIPALWVQIQVLKDANLTLQDAKDCGGERVFRAAGEEWKRDALAFLRKSQGADPGETIKTQPRYRTRALEWCVAFDRQLSVLFPKGLSRFQQPEAASRGDPSGWPLLSLCVDQGSDGWSAAAYLMRRAGFNMLLQFDPSHRCWNDSQAALQQAGMWASALVLQATFNLDHGPWKDGKLHSDVVQVASLYSRLERPEECPLLQSLLWHIIRDDGDSDQLANLQVASDIA